MLTCTGRYICCFKNAVQFVMIETRVSRLWRMTGQAHHAGSARRDRCGRLVDRDHRSYGIVLGFGDDLQYRVAGVEVQFKRFVAQKRWQARACRRSDHRCERELVTSVDVRVEVACG